MLNLSRSKLPSDLLFELDLRKTDEGWRLTTFRVVLQAYRKAKEDAWSLHNHCVPAFTPALPQRTEASSSNWKRPDNQHRPITRVPILPRKSFAVSTSSNRGPSRATRPSGLASFTQLRKCKYCAETHYSDQCRRFQDVDSRKTRILGHCFKCLSNTHTALECTAFKECLYYRATTNHRSLSQCNSKTKFSIVQWRPRGKQRDRQTPLKHVKVWGPPTCLSSRSQQLRPGSSCGQPSHCFNTMLIRSRPSRLGCCLTVGANNPP